MLLPCRNDCVLVMVEKRKLKTFCQLVDPEEEYPSGSAKNCGTHGLTTSVPLEMSNVKENPKLAQPTKPIATVKNDSMRSRIFRGTVSQQKKSRAHRCPVCHSPCLKRFVNSNEYEHEGESLPEPGRATTHGTGSTVLLKLISLCRIVVLFARFVPALKHDSGR